MEKKDLAPRIFRQRLLIEGIFTIEKIDEYLTRKFLYDLIDHLGVHTYTEPTVRSSTSIGVGKKENQGIEAFVPLIESGISFYTWDSEKFFALIIFTCKKFDEDEAISFTKDWFKTKEIYIKSF